MRSALATHYFQSLEECHRLEEMLTERAVELLGAIEQNQVKIEIYEEMLVIEDAPNSLRVFEGSLREFWKLGFKRVSLEHWDGTETFYYEGGPTGGKHGRDL